MKRMNESDIGSTQIIVLMLQGASSQLAVRTSSSLSDPYTGKGIFSKTAMPFAAATVV
jgi:hypothetical protein